MVEPDAFHRHLAMLDPPEGATELAEQLLAALRIGHDLGRRLDGAVHRYVWECRRCEAQVLWSPSQAPAARLAVGEALERTCSEEIRHWQAMNLASTSMLAWLAEQEGASCG